MVQKTQVAKIVGAVALTADEMAAANRLANILGLSRGGCLKKCALIGLATLLTAEQPTATPPKSSDGQG